jgi:hypothetical protein
MQITVTSVVQNTLAASNGRTYQQIEVYYKNDKGENQSKKLVAFSNPEVFKTAKTWQGGEVVDVKTVKNAKTGYWDWVSIGGDNAVSETKPASAASGTRVTGSNYETKEERAQRQILIVRQSSLSSAVELLGPGKSVDDVINVAKQFEAYVFGDTETSDDIPA